MNFSIRYLFTSVCGASLEVYAGNGPVLDEKDALEYVATDIMVMDREQDIRVFDKVEVIWGGDNDIVERFQFDLTRCLPRVVEYFFVGSALYSII